MSNSTQQLRAHIKEMGKLAEVIGALSKEFERQPRVEVLVTLKSKLTLLDEEWAKAEVILSSKANS